MKRIVLIFTALFSVVLLHAQTPDWDWAHNYGGTSGDYGVEVCTDNAGNSYTIGYFSGTMTVGSTPLVSSGGIEVFIFKSDPSGNVVWAVDAGGVDSDSGWDIALDTDGNIYVTGYFWGGAYFGSTLLTSVGQFDIFVAKLDPDGNWLWARRAGGSYYDHGYGVATDGSGNCIVTGYYTGSATFGSFTLTDTATYGEEFVAKLDTDGNWLWASTSTCSDASRGQAVSTDTTGNVYVAGSINNTTTFGETTLTCSGNNDTFVAKLDANGAWLWAVRGGGAANDWANSIATNGDGYSVIIGGFTSESAEYGTFTIAGDGWGSHIYIAGLNSAGVFQWAVSAGALDYDDEGRDVVLDASGNAYITGYFEGTTNLPAEFGTLSLVPYGGRDIFVAKLNSFGEFQWAVQAGSPATMGGTDSGTGVAVSPGGHIVGTGSFTFTGTFGTYTLTASGYDIYLTRLTDPLVAPNPVILLFPEEGTMNLPIAGFDLQWEPDNNGTLPDSYVVYMADDPEQIYTQNYWSTGDTSFNPVVDGGLTFGFDQVWYWTVEAINVGGSSFVVPPRSFTTQSENTVVSFPATWDFEGLSFPPDGWTTADLDGGGTFWTMMTEDNHTPGGSQCAVHSYSSEAPEGQRGWMITPPVAVPIGQRMTLSFWNKNWWEDYYGYNGVLVNTTNDPNDPDWIELWSPVRVWHDWIQQFVDISAYGGQTVYFAFKYQGFDANSWIVDDVSIYQVEPVTVFPAVWNFEDDTFPPANWSYADLDGTPTTWQVTTDFNQTPGGGKAATHPYSTLWSEEPGQNGWLITPPVQVPGGVNMVMDFWYINIYSGANKYCAVKVNTVNDPEDPNWVEVWHPVMVYEEWRKQAINISAFGGQTIYIAFHYQGNDADNWIVDDVTIYHPEGNDTFGPVISYLPPLSTPRYDLDKIVTATVIDDPTYNSELGGIILHYKHWGSEDYIAEPMVLDSDDTYYAVIPAPGYYTEIDYYFEAWDIHENHTSTNIYSWYYVENPCWLSYDLGGTGSQSFAEEFGVAAVYENPFFDQGNPVRILQTGCGANTNTNANLCIYSYDGYTMTPIFTPQEVALNSSEWFTFTDFSGEEILIETQYFVIAYENIPAYTGIWHERRLDYGASFRIDNGVLSEMQIPGSWILPVQITNGSLPAPELAIGLLDGNPLISWSAVPGANWYEVYYSLDPNMTDPWYQIQGTQDTSYYYTDNTQMGFFRVVAKSDLPLKTGMGEKAYRSYNPMHPFKNIKQSVKKK